MDRQIVNIMRTVRQSNAPMSWSITVGGALFYRDGEPFTFYWQEVASMVWDREIREGDHTEPVALCFKGQPIKTYYPQ